MTSVPPSMRKRPFSVPVPAPSRRPRIGQYPRVAAFSSTEPAFSRMSPPRPAPASFAMSKMLATMRKLRSSKQRARPPGAFAVRPASRPSSSFRPLGPQPPTPSPTRMSKACQPASSSTVAVFKAFQIVFAMTFRPSTRR